MQPDRANQTSEELDELAIRRVRAGDERAARELVLTYQERVFHVLSRILGHRDRALVEDTAQETFLAVFRALPRFDSDGPAKLSTWILTIASRRAVDAIRRRKPLPESPSALSVESGANRLTIADAVRRAINTLPPEFRAAFVLREYYDFEYAEIAETLDIEVGTVRSRLSRARKRLREELSEMRNDS